MTLTRNLYEMDEVVSALQICLRTNNPQALFWLWELVVSQEEALALCTLTNDPLPEEDWVMRYCRVTNTLSHLHTLQSDWSSWTATVGRRHARLHAIPPDAIHKDTTRGRIAFKYTNIGDLRDPVPQLVDGCQFWRTVIQEYGITMDAETEAVVFPDDDRMEDFYDRYFPDDIPDEWSKSDQEKSHGRGVKRQ